MSRHDQPIVRECVSYRRQELCSINVLTRDASSALMGVHNPIMHPMLILPGSVGAPKRHNYTSSIFLTREARPEPNAPGIFDTDKLTWFNAEYIRKLPFDEYLKMVTPWFDKALAGKQFDYKRLAELMQSRTEVFNRVPDMVRFLVEMPEYDLDLYNNKKMKTNPDVAKESLTLVKPVLEGIEDWSEANIHDTVMAAIAESGKKNGAVLWPLRIAISGLASTPGGAFEIAYLLGKEETLRRLNSSMEKLSKDA